jgi:hypothetical protein
MLYEYVQTFDMTENLKKILELKVAFIPSVQELPASTTTRSFDLESVRYLVTWVWFPDCQTHASRPPACRTPARLLASSGSK